MQTFRQLAATLLVAGGNLAHHVSRRPLERFEASLGDASEDVRDRFYRANFLDLMGSAALVLAA